jgi:DNA-directed RNA polymerase subunit RPC12/RpoP
MKDNEYQCAQCKGIFEYGWSDEEAIKEATDTFGKPPAEWKDNAAIVCDDCYQEMLPANHPDLVARAKEKI